MFADEGDMGPKRDQDGDLFGGNPPLGVYFQTEYEYNLNHPLNANLDLEHSCFGGEIVKTLDMAKSLAHATAQAFAIEHTLSIIEDEPDEDDDSELALLPSFYLVDPMGSSDERSIVMTVSVRLLDFRDETLQ
jgi:hypothetical protein